MLQGTCIDLELASSFPETVYLFPNGNNHYYVSRFQRQSAHMGCFHKKRFQLIDEWPPEPKLDLPDLEAGKVYSAQLIWRRKGYRGKELKQYYIKPDNQKNTNFYADKELKEFQGRYPLHWFADFKLIEDIEEQLVELVEEPTNFEQMSLFEVI